MELIRTVCSRGQFILTENTIEVDAGNTRTTIYRDQLIGVESKMTSPRFLWSPGTTKLIFSTSSGQRLEASMIRTNIANEILAELNRR